MNKNGLISDIMFYAKVGLEMFWIVFSTIAGAVIWLCLMLLPSYIGMAWMLWLTIPLGFVALFAFIGYMIDKE